MNTRVAIEKEYWDKAALDPDVDKKYIADCDLQGCLDAIGNLKGKVLDLGCGVGRLMKDGYCGVDISPNMLKIAAKRHPSCEFKLADGRTIPYPDETFDSAYSMLLFQHLPFDAVGGYIKEVRRVLKDNGIFIFQYIEGTEDEPFSKHHIIELEGFTFGTEKELVHPQWTWIRANKI